MPELETEISQLFTDRAMRAEDPLRWVETRNILATNAIAPQRSTALDQIVRLRDAVANFFNQAELVAIEYGIPTKPGTPLGFAR